jgi:hypothetical protein
MRSSPSTDWRNCWPGAPTRDAAYQQPITTNDVKKAINLRNRLQRVRQKMSVASATNITSGPEN